MNVDELRQAGDVMVAAAQARKAAEKKQREMRWVSWGVVIGLGLLFSALRVFG